jgi:uncharacterized protein YqeY
MTLSEQVNEQIKKAMLAKDSVRLSALRAIKSAVLLEQTSGKGTELSDDAFGKIIQKMVKQRQDSLAIYESQNRSDLAKEEADQLAVIQEFLPPQMEDGELEQMLRQLLAQNQIQSAEQFGKAMGMASKELAGRVDNKRISEVLKKLLQP